MIAPRKSSPGPMTVGEFLEWDGGKGRRWELRDGVAVAMAPASDDHGAIQAELARLIGNHLRRTADDNWPENPDLVTATGMLRLDSINLILPLRDAYRTTSLL